MFLIISKVIEVITPANYELAGKYCEGYDVSRAFPPVMNPECKSNR
jgi:hypothetical protein